MVRFRRIALDHRIFFITTNLATGVPHLDASERNLVLDKLNEQRDNFLLLAYVVMPSHLHLLIRPRGKSIVRIMRDLKSTTGFAILRRRTARGPLWQARYFDHIIRRVHHFWQKAEYVHGNPVEAGLVKRPEDWPWSSHRAFARIGISPIAIDEANLPSDPKALLWPLPSVDD
jgi:putative transposase